MGFFFVSHCNRRHPSEGNSKGACIIVVFLAGLATNSTNRKKFAHRVRGKRLFLMRKLQSSNDLEALLEVPTAPATTL
jgi:hypothetical protein